MMNGFQRVLCNLAGLGAWLRLGVVALLLPVALSTACGEDHDSSDNVVAGNAAGTSGAGLPANNGSNSASGTAATGATSTGAAGTGVSGTAGTTGISGTMGTAGTAPMTGIGPTFGNGMTGMDGGTLSADCPAAAPADGAPCSGGGFMACDYGMTQCRCFRGSWSCDTPDPNCPDQAPMAGDSCAVEGTSCRYGRRNNCECSGGLWSCGGFMSGQNQDDTDGGTAGGMFGRGN